MPSQTTRTIMMPSQTTRTIVRTNCAVFTLQEVANLLYEQLPIEDRLPGSPSLEIVVETHGLVLIQTHRNSSI